MNCATNVMGRFLPRFYIFKSERVCDDSRIKLNNPLNMRGHATKA
jgi:hypothetical protein